MLGFKDVYRKNARLTEQVVNNLSASFLHLQTGRTILLLICQFLAGFEFCFLSKIMISAIVLDKAELSNSHEHDSGYLLLVHSKCCISTEVCEAVFS